MMYEINGRSDIKKNWELKDTATGTIQKETQRGKGKRSSAGQFNRTNIHIVRISKEGEEEKRFTKNNSWQNSFFIILSNKIN